MLITITGYVVAFGGDCRLRSNHASPFSDLPFRDRGLTWVGPSKIKGGRASSPSFNHIFAFKLQSLIGGFDKSRLNPRVPYHGSVCHAFWDNRTATVHSTRCMHVFLLALLETNCAVC